MDDGFEGSIWAEAVAEFQASRGTTGANVVRFKAAPGGVDDYDRAPDHAYQTEVQSAEPEGLRNGGAAFFSAASLEHMPVPDRKWLVRDWIPSGNVTLLTGDGGTGKSLLALQLAAAVATSGVWLGRGVLGGKAVFLSAEDDRDELHRRIADVVEAEGLEWRHLANLELCSMAGEDALLATLPALGGPMTPTRLYDLVAAKLEQSKPELLVLDTLADLFPGNENDRAQARQFIGLLRRQAIAHDCALVLLAHPSLAGLVSGAGTSGSTGWNNSVRSRLYLSRVADGGHEPDTDARVLTNKKLNYGPTGAEITMRWQAGVFVADQAETGLDRVSASAKAERVFLELLRLFTAQGRPVNPTSGPNCAPAIFEKHPEAEGVRKAAFRRAMDALLSKGSIRVVQGKRSMQLEEVQK